MNELVFNASSIASYYYLSGLQKAIRQIREYPAGMLVAVQSFEQ
jgi:hypothetical protein